MTSSEIADLFREYSEPDEFTTQYQLGLFQWSQIQRVGHGYTAYTTYKCRCETCTKANTEYMRAYNARKQESALVFMLFVMLMKEQRRREVRTIYWREHKRKRRPVSDRQSCGVCGADGHNARTCAQARAA